MFDRNMKLARFDKGLKEDRNLDVKDDEFHNTQVILLDTLCARGDLYIYKFVRPL